MSPSALEALTQGFMAGLHVATPSHVGLMARALVRLRHFPPDFFRIVVDAALALESQGTQLTSRELWALTVLTQALGAQEALGDRFVWESADVFERVLARFADVDSEGADPGTLAELLAACS